MPPILSHDFPSKSAGINLVLETQKSRFSIKSLPFVLEKFKPTLIETFTDDYPNKMASLRSFLEQQSEDRIPKKVKDILDMLIPALEQPIAYKDIFNKDRNARSEFKNSLEKNSEDSTIFNKQRLNAGAKAPIAYLNFFLGPISSDIFAKFKKNWSELLSSYNLIDPAIEPNEFSEKYTHLGFEQKVNFTIDLSDIYYEVILDLLKQYGLDWKG